MKKLLKISAISLIAYCGYAMATPIHYVIGGERSSCHAIPAGQGICETDFFNGGSLGTLAGIYHTNTQVFDLATSPTPSPVFAVHFQNNKGSVAPICFAATSSSVTRTSKSHCMQKNDDPNITYYWLSVPSATYLPSSGYIEFGVNNLIQGMQQTSDGQTVPATVALKVVSTLVPSHF